MAITLITNYAAMKSSILQWLRENSGADMGKAIFLNQEGDRPEKPYATLQVMTDNIKTGDDDIRPEFNAGIPELIYRTFGYREMIVNVQLYTEPAKASNEIEAADRLNRALILLDHPIIVTQFNDANFSVLEHTPVIRLDEQLGERWERRASSDLRILYTAESVDDGSFGEWVESVEIPTVENTNLIVNK